MSKTSFSNNDEALAAEEIVTALYQGLLKRDPDPAGLQSHIASLRQNGPLPVVRSFLESTEFKRMYFDKPPGLNLNSGPRSEVQVLLSEEDKDKLWKHIQKVWTKFGEEEPYWSVLTGKEYRSDRIHREKLVEFFYETGSHDLEYFDAYLQRNDLQLPKDATIAEFGCGVGRVTRFLARRFSRVLAFDISPSHLAAARERLQRDGIDNVEFILLDTPEVLNRLRGFDVFFSLIVLQHNPPPIIYQVLDKTFEGLASGGTAFFQVPTYSLGYNFSFQDYYDGQYNRTEMELHFVPQQKIFELFHRHNIQTIEVRQDHCIGNFNRWISNTFLARKEAAKPRGRGRSGADPIKRRAQTPAVR